MLKRDRGAILASGLIIGAVLTIVLLVWVVGLNYCPGNPCQYSKPEIGPPMAKGEPSEPIGKPQSTDGQTADNTPVDPQGGGWQPSYLEFGGQPYDSKASNNSEQQGEDPFFPWLADGAAQWAMVFISLAAVIVSWLAVILVNKSLAAADCTYKMISDQFAAENPPRFMVKQISLDLEEWAKPEVKRTGGLWVFNAGPTRAKIHLSTVVFHSGKAPPASRPFDHALEANQILRPQEEFDGGKGDWRTFTGDGCKASISDIKEAITDGSTMKFYIIGRVHFKDARENTARWDRHMVFCRVYDPSTKRFIETGDDDYEYQT